MVMKVKVKHLRCFRRTFQEKLSRIQEILSNCNFRKCFFFRMTSTLLWEKKQEDERNFVRRPLFDLQS